MVIKFVVGESKTRPNWVLADVSEEALKKVVGDDLGKITEHEVVFRVPSFADSLYDQGLKVVGDDVTLNIAAMKAERMFRLLKSWDFVDSKGKSVPASKESMLNMHPLIPTIILIQLDKALSERGVG
jgi:hypothetical protein